MPNTYTTCNGVTLSRDAFITHYVAAWMAAASVQWYCSREAAKAADPTSQPFCEALCCAEEAWK